MDRDGQPDLRLHFIGEFSQRLWWETNEAVIVKRDRRNVRHFVGRRAYFGDKVLNRRVTQLAERLVDLEETGVAAVGAAIGTPARPDRIVAQCVVIEIMLLGKRNEPVAADLVDKLVLAVDRQRQRIELFRRK